MSAARGEHGQLLTGPLTDGMPSLIAAAHELKSPLALIRQLSLSLEDGNITESDRRRMLRQISLTSERSLRLTSDLTRSVRLHDALFELEPVNPQQICEDVVHELMPLFKAHNREVKLVKRRHPLLLVANRDLLRRIITNFSDNALHYSEGCETVKIRIGELRSGQIVRLSVRDYGPAISADILRSVRGKLATANSSIHARPQSSGLGLYIATQFADAMNGKVGVIRHNDGATFYVDLQASRQLSLL